MTALQFRPRVGKIARPPRDKPANPFLALVDELEPGSDEGIEFDLTYTNALETFPDLPDGKDSEGNTKRRPVTRDEAMAKLLARTRRQLTEAGNEAKPPVTVFWDGGIEQDDGETVTVFVKAGKGKIERKT